MVSRMGCDRKPARSQRSVRLYEILEGSSHDTMVGQEATSVVVTSVAGTFQATMA